MVVGVRQKVLDPLALRLLLELVHHPRAVALHLVGLGDGAEGDLGEAGGVRPVRHAADHLPLELARERLVRAVEHEAHDVLLRHLRQLLAVAALAVHQRDERLGRAVVLVHAEPQQPRALVPRVDDLALQRSGVLREWQRLRRRLARGWGGGRVVGPLALDAGDDAHGGEGRGGNGEREAL